MHVIETDFHYNQGGKKYVRHSRQRRKVIDPNPELADDDDDDDADDDDDDDNGFKI